MVDEEIFVLGWATIVKPVQDPTNGLSVVQRIVYKSTNTSIGSRLEKHFEPMSPAAVQIDGQKNVGIDKGTGAVELRHLDVIQEADLTFEPLVDPDFLVLDQKIYANVILKVPFRPCWREGDGIWEDRCNSLCREFEEFNRGWQKEVSPACEDG